MCNKPLADYVKLPSFDEYKEWFKAFADLKREDSIMPGRCLILCPCPLMQKMHNTTKELISAVSQIHK